MKVKTIARNPDDYLRETKRDIYKVQRNYDPDLHPLEAPREYSRALNAAKLDRVFAKPFVGNLDGHRDGVFVLGKHPSRLSLLASGSCDGEIRLWDLPERKCISAFQAHEGFIRGLCFTPDGNQFLTLGDDKSIKTWQVEGDHEEPTNTILGKNVMTGLAHHFSEPRFVTCGEVCQLWEESRNEPIRTYSWGVDNLHDVSFNPIETHLLAACSSSRGIILYDIRDTGPIRKVIMKLRPNKLCWNPTEAFIFTVANEDYNLYTFDARKLKSPVNVHMGHVAAVTTLDYSPTGKEFVSGSYDKTIRIYKASKANSRDIYHTKRMQRLTTVLWSLDNKYILSGSDEMNIRIWKANASEKLGALRPREKAALNYSHALREKFSAHPEISRIVRHRHVPKHILHNKKEHKIIRDKERRKEANRRKHSKPGTVPHVPEREKHVVGEQE